MSDRFPPRGIHCSFDSARIAEEIERLHESDWLAVGPDVAELSLVDMAAGEQIGAGGSLQAAGVLDRCPYLREIIAGFDCVIGFAQLVRVRPGGEQCRPTSLDPYLQRRVTLQIPVVGDCEFIVDAPAGTEGTQFSGRAGHAWVNDGRAGYRIINPAERPCILLRFHTFGNSRLNSQPASTGLPITPAAADQLAIEQYPYPAVVGADELAAMLAELGKELTQLQLDWPELFANLQAAIQNLVQQWRILWVQYADTAAGLPHYQERAASFVEHSRADLAGQVIGADQEPAEEVLRQWLEYCINPAEVARRAALAPSAAATVASTSVQQLMDISLFDCPVFIVAAPRSGSTLLFESLQQNKQFWTLGDESHQVFESINELHPASRDFDSNALEADDLSTEIATALMGALLRRLRNCDGELFAQIPADQRVSTLRFLEKTPKNALRIPFLLALFPNARFVFLHRAARPNIGSIIDAWNSGKFVTYPNLPGWSGQPWSLLLPEGWRALNGRPLAEIAAWQWASTNLKVIQDLQQLPRERWHALSYESMMQDRQTAFREICEFAEVPFGPRMQTLASQPLPASKYTLTQPSADKWQKHQADIESAIAVLDVVADAEQLISRL